jgi:hypothetical protein
MTDNKKPTPAAPSTEVASGGEREAIARIIIGHVVDGDPETPEETADAILALSLTAKAPPVEASDQQDQRESTPDLVSRLSEMLGDGTDFDNYTFSIKRGNLRRLLAALSPASDVPPIASSGQDLRASLAAWLGRVDGTMVEICEPHPDNPSPNIRPVARKELLALLSAPAVPPGGDLVVAGERYTFPVTRREDCGGEHREWTEPVTVPDVMVQHIKRDAILEQLAMRDAVYTVQGSIYERMEACLERDGAPVAHFARYADAIQIAAALNSSLVATPQPEAEEGA